MSDHHDEDEVRWIRSMNARRLYGDLYVATLEDVTRVLSERDEARRELAEARASIKDWQPHEPVERTAYVETLERDLGNLLAIIHRDGGHHAGRVGTTQAVDDAHKAWATLVLSRDEARERERLAKMVAARMQAERDEARSHTSTAAFMRIERERDEARRNALAWADERDDMRRQRDEARAEVERLRSETASALEEMGRACDGLETAVQFADEDRARAEAQLAALRAEIGEAWFVDECDLATALRRKTSMLQRLADGGAE